jgi:hypothetical protein
VIEEASTMDGESAIPLEGLASGVDQLEAVVVFMLSHIYTYASWIRPNVSVSAVAVATSLREAYLAGAQASSRLTVAGGNGEPPPTGFATLTLEDPSRIVIVQRVRSFGVATLFERDVPLGLARAHAHKIARTLEHELPYEAAPKITPPSSQAAVTLMMPTYVAPSAKPAPPVERTPARQEPEEEAAPETSQHIRPPSTPPPPAEPVAPPTRVERPETASPPTIPKAPESGTGERLGLRRPTPPMPTASVSDGAASRPAPVPALSLVAHSERAAPAPADVADASPEARAIRLVAYVERTSIEPHISLLRLALRSGLGVAELRELKRVTPEQLLLLETAAEDMLGVERGKLTERIRSAAVVLPLPQRGAS